MEHFNLVTAREQLESFYLVCAKLKDLYKAMRKYDMYNVFYIADAYPCATKE